MKDYFPIYFQVPEIDWGTITIPDSALSSVEQISGLEEVSQEHAQEKVRGAEIQVSETVRFYYYYYHYYLHYNSIISCILNLCLQIRDRWNDFFSLGANFVKKK